MLTIELAIKGRRNNFTLLRLIAAITVLFVHSHALSLGKGSRDFMSQFLIPNWGASAATVAVDLFFVISGFLITASYLHRNSIIAYAEARLLRIYPALLVVILLSVFVLGVSATTLSPGKYLSHEATWSYFYKNTSLMFGLQLGLPWTFQDNPFPGSVNGSLWTLPIEMTMYIWIAVLGLLGVLGKRSVFNIFVLAVVLVYLNNGPEIFIQGEEHRQRFPLIFLFGAFLYVNRDKIPLDFRVLLGLIILMWLFKGHGRYSDVSKFGFFSYLVLYISLAPTLIVPTMDRYGDYSYGIYIYAFPVQQACALWIPNITPSIMFMTALPITMLLAVFSWHYIEKPALKLKGKIRFGNRWADQRIQLGKR